MASYGESGWKLFQNRLTYLPVNPLSKPSEIPPRPAFRGFEAPDFWLVPGYRRNLPHWRLEGATYFITFRLADSIPAEVAEGWADERRRWLRTHGIDLPPGRDDPQSFQGALAKAPPEARREFGHQERRRFFIELDRCHGCCALAKAHDSVSGALEFFHGQRVWLGDYVVMPNHVHVIVQPFPGIPLEEWLYSVKRFSARDVRAMLGDEGAPLRSGHLWQPESFDRVIRDGDELARVRRYIAENPAKLDPGTYSLVQKNWLDEFAPPP